MIKIPKEELLLLLEERGYHILIEQKGDSKFVKFCHKFQSKPYKLKHSYCTSYTDLLIKYDTVYDLLKWTGLKVKFTLDY